MTSVDDLLSDLSRGGWLVNNAYQTDDSRWRVNIRRPTPSGDWFTDWAVADTLADALCECMSKLLDATFTEEPEVTGYIDTTPIPDLLSTLGLKPKSAPIVRRF